jgi:phospholipid/cholesterol/gamma-HCH transport system substrate-binding protein
MSSLSVEVRVGGFVLAALAVLVGFVLVLGDFSLAPGFKLHADFAYSGGLQVGAPVKVSGIRVGRVTDLSILDAASRPASAAPAAELGRSRPPVVRASLVVEEPARSLLTQSAKLYIGMQGFIGEAYVEVEPGAAGAPPLAEGSSVRGVDAARLHVMIAQMAALLDAMGGRGGDEVGLGGLAAALSRLLDDVDGVLSEHRTTIETAIADTAAAAGELRQLTSAIHRAVGDGQRLKTLLADAGDAVAGVKRDLPPLLAHARRALDDVAALTARLDGALQPGEVEELVAELHQTLSHLQHTAHDARRVMETVRRGQGTLGGLVADPQAYDDLKEMLRDLKRNPWKMFWRD